MFFRLRPLAAGALATPDRRRLCAGIARGIVSRHLGRGEGKGKKTEASTFIRQMGKEGPRSGLNHIQARLRVNIVAKNRRSEQSFCAPTAGKKTRKMGGDIFSVPGLLYSRSGPFDFKWVDELALLCSGWAGHSRQPPKRPPSHGPPPSEPEGRGPRAHTSLERGTRSKIQSVFADGTSWTAPSARGFARHAGFFFFSGSSRPNFLATWFAKAVAGATRNGPS